MWVWLKLKLTLKGDSCEVSVTAFFCFVFFFANFFMHSPNAAVNCNPDPPNLGE